MLVSRPWGLGPPSRIVNIAIFHACPLTWAGRNHRELIVLFPRFLLRASTEPPRPKDDLSPRDDRYELHGPSQGPWCPGGRQDTRRTLGCRARRQLPQKSGLKSECRWSTYPSSPSLPSITVPRSPASQVTVPNCLVQCLTGRTPPHRVVSQIDIGFPSRI